MSAEKSERFSLSAEKSEGDGKWGDGRRVFGGLGRVVERGRARKVIEQATEGMPGMASRGDSH